MCSAPTSSTTSFFIYRSTFWVGVFRIRVRWLIKKSRRWDNNKLRAAIGFYMEFIATSWTRSFIVRLTKSGPKSRDHSLVLLEFEKIMLLYCWLKVYKMGLELICFWLTVPTNREWAQIWNAWKYFCLFRHKFGCSWLGLAVKILQ